MAGRTVTYTLKADTDNFESGLKRSRNSAQDFFKAMERDAERFFAGQKNAGKALEGFGVPIGIISDGFKVAGAAVVAFGAAVVGAFAISSKSLLDYSDKIVTLHQRTGLTTDTLQVLGHMAKVSGTDVDSLAKAVVRMEVNLVKGDAAFKGLGLSVSALKAMSPDAAFAKIGSAIGAISDPMQRAAAAVAVFGKSGSELLPVFAMNLGKAKEEAESLGLVLNGDMLFASEALGDAIDTTQASAIKFGERLAGIVQQSPATLAVVEQLGKLFGSLSQFVEKNGDTLVKWTNIVILAMAKLGELVGVEIQLVAKIGKLAGMDFGGVLSGVDALGKSMDNFNVSLQKSILAKLKWAAIDMGGAGVLLPGTQLPTQGQVGSTFNGGSRAAATAAARKRSPEGTEELDKINRRLDKIVAKALSADWGGLEQRAHRASLEGAVSNALAGGYNLAVPTGADGKPKQYSFDNSKSNVAITTSSFNTAQALQNLANIAATSGSKLGKGLASILAGGAGIGSGISGLKSMSGLSGLTGVLGKAGMYGQIASSALSIGSAIFGLFKKKPKEPPPPPPKAVDAATWRNFQGEQLGKGTSGLAAGVAGIQLTSTADLTSQATIAGLQFWSIFKAQGLTAAADATKGVIAKLVENLSQYGSEAAAAVLAPIQQQIALAENDAFRGASDGARGFAEVLAGQVNARMPMTIEQFSAFGQQAMAAFEQARAGAIATGLSTEEATRAALQAVGPLVTTAVDAAGTYGFAIDANTQSLLDQAAASGVAFATDKTDRLVMSIDALTSALGGVPPAVNAITGAINGIPRDVQVNVHTNHTGGTTGPNPGDGSGLEGPGFASGSGGLRNFGIETQARLHGREAVLTETQFNNLTRAAEGGSGVSVTFGDISVVANDAKGGRDAASAFAAEFERLLVDGQLRTLLQDRLGVR